MADSATTLVRVYNKFLIDMAMDLKVENAAFKKALKATHKAIDPGSSSYIECAAASLGLAGVKESLLGVEVADILGDERVQAFEPLPGVPMRAAVEGLNPEGQGALRTYLFVLASLAATYAESKEGGGGNDALIGNVLQVLAAVQTGTHNDALEGIMDDDIVSLLERVGEATALATKGAGGDAEGGAEGGGADGDGGGDAFMKSIENSMIADLAKEISTEIDLTQLGGGDPAELLNFANLGDSNSLLGSIVGKVGAKIQTKLANGELKHDELLAEAMSMLKMFDSSGASGSGSASGLGGLAGLAGNPMVSNLLKKAVAAQSGGTGQVKSARARERLREKLQRSKDKEAATTTAAKGKSK